MKEERILADLYYQGSTYFLIDNRMLALDYITDIIKNLVSAFASRISSNTGSLCYLFPTIEIFNLCKAKITDMLDEFYANISHMISTFIDVAINANTLINQVVFDSTDSNYLTIIFAYNNKCYEVNSVIYKTIKETAEQTLNFITILVEKFVEQRINS